MLTTAAARPSLPTRLWLHLIVALTARRAAARVPSASVRGVDTLLDAGLRDLGFERDQVGGNITFAKGAHQRLF